MQRLLPLLALLSLTTACRSPVLTAEHGALIRPAMQLTQPVEFPKLEDLDPELRKEADALIAQLGAESFKDRLQAREALKAMTPAIIPLLEKHASNEEPEIRKSVPKIAQALYKQLTFTIPDLKLTMIAIRPGSFMMGSAVLGAYEKPVHKVTLTKAFWIGRTEITQSQYESITGKNPSEFKGANNPVDSISRAKAVEFCKKLTTGERTAGRLPAGLEYRLPTEAEWEYCCRAGSKTKYSFGDDESKLKEYANYDKTPFYGNNKTAPVASFKPNAWGLYDMHGNVAEWCYDWGADYLGGAQVDPIGPASASFRMSRGGCWYLSADCCCSATRSRDMPDNSGSTRGFRIVLGYPIVPAEAQTK